ncbi:nicotinamide-nucleotide amidohydrolase family protein [Gallaecimonas sp. GXIMD4217]|uniref:CinA family protein n=1 Tax=Gallaecimonas sp. GXIMD4217 TaxID=3131927 RepID=UPI00311AD88C
MHEKAPAVEDLASELGVRLKALGKRVTTAESCTGGLVAAAITSVAGSSSWFDEAFVTYANAAKLRRLGVSDQSLARDGAVSQAVVEQMARGALEAAGADLAVAISGIAGPDGGSADKPVGTVWLAWASEQGVTSRKLVFDGDRQAVRQQATAAALQGLLESPALNRA